MVDPASAGAVPSVPEIASQGYQLAFSDEFNGTKLDTEKWDYRNDSKGLSTQLPANVTVSDGCLHVAVKKEFARGKNYTAGGIISKAEFQYGYYEARFRIPAGNGWHTSFYTEHYNGKDTGVTRGREEIDICEQDSSSSPVFGYNYTLHDWGSKLTPRGVEVPAPKLPVGHVRPHENHRDLHDFHIWGMEFTPQIVNFYFDGELRGSVDATLFKHTPMNIWLTSIGWGGKIDDSKLPSDAEFDYVRFFTKPSTTFPTAQSAVAPPAPRDPAQAQLIDQITNLGGIVKTTDDGAVASIIFTYTHQAHPSPAGPDVPPYAVTDNLVRQIAMLPKLTALELNMSPKLTEASFKNIGSMTQLTHLSLPGPCMTDAAMVDIGALTHLQYLRLTGALAVTPAGWAHLESMTQLQTLWIAETRFDDAAMQHLKPLKQLREITLYGTLVTDAGAEVLKELPNLQSVRIAPKVSAQEVAKLQAALPKCRFWR